MILPLIFDAMSDDWRQRLLESGNRLREPVSQGRGHEEWFMIKTELKERNPEIDPDLIDAVVSLAFAIARS